MEISTIYNPHEQTEQELLDGFVIREKEFKTIFHDIQKNKMPTPPQHYIVYGIRGNGKTSLLLKLFYEVRKDEDLNKWLIPVIFKEEQYNLRTLYKLWEHVAEYLGEDFSEFFDLLDKMELNEESDNYEEKCFELLQSYLERNEKKLVLLFDNFGVFLNKLTDREHQRLREILITSADIRIIGTSTFVDEVTYDYGKPFFDFFKPVYLKGLNKEDTIKLLLKLNEKAPSGDINKIIEQNPGRIEALRRLTSGIPRTIVLLYQIFIDNSNGRSFKDLDVLLDKVTPLYKSRMDDLPPQQQEIADIIAKNWDAITVKEIVKKSKIPSNAVSAQLKQLEKNRLIIKKGTSTKNNMYQVAERFFNIWYLMRNARNKDKFKVRWLVNFLEIWCDRKELTVRAKSHIEGLKSGKLYDKYAFHLSEAYAQMVSSPKMQHDIIASTRKYLESINSELVCDLSDSDIELSKKAYEYIKEEKPELALVNLLKIERKKGEHYFYIGYIYHEFIKDLMKAVEFYLLAIKKNVLDAMFNLGYLYNYECKDYEKAKEYYLMAVEKGDSGAMLNLGILYNNEYKDYEKARDYYLMAVGKGNTSANVILGFLYDIEYKDYEKAKKYYLKAVELGDSDAIFNLGNLYYNGFKDYEKAKEYYQMAVEKGDSSAMLNLGNLYYNEYKDYEKAKEYYQMAVRKGHSSAMFNLGNLYYNEYKDYEKAKEYYQMAVEKGYSSAMFNLGHLYTNEYKDYERAKVYYLMAAENGNSKAMVNLGNLYSDEYKEYEKAEECYLKALEFDKYLAMNSLAWMYFDLKKNKAEALNYSQQAFENDKSNYSLHAYSCILLWHNEIEKAIEVSKEFMNNEKSYSDFGEDIKLFLLLLLAKKQYHHVLNLFKENNFNIQDRYKPIYYALMTLLQNEYTDEIKRMGSELEETVKEILEKILQLAKDYE
jgi:TPR repeat protein